MRKCLNVLPLFWKDAQIIHTCCNNNREYANLFFRYQHSLVPRKHALFFLPNLGDISLPSVWDALISQAEQGPGPKRPSQPRFSDPACISEFLSSIENQPLPSLGIVIGICLKDTRSYISTFPREWLKEATLFLIIISWSRSLGVFDYK